jgi:hypothetical protein
MQKFFSVLSFKDRQVFVKSDKHLKCCSSTRNKSLSSGIWFKKEMTEDWLFVKWMSRQKVQSSYDTYQKIKWTSEMRQISGKLIPRELRKKHKEHCFFFSFRITWICNQLEFLKNIRNSKGTQTMGIFTKLSSSHNGNPCPFCEQQGMPLHRNNKLMLTVFSEWMGTMHRIYSPQGHIYTKSADTLDDVASCK